ncbi:MAG: calcium/sodium antiporter [Paludibacteraceae bacterium]|nr:calcium/sodium antiporter [Paludibacteraceae bacterium]
MILDIVFIVAGFVFLIKGADWLVGGASGLAKKHNVSDLVIGLTIVAFGTSAPELVVNSIASVDKHSDIVFGNIIGSNNFNLFFILGTVALIFPVTVQRSMIRKEIPFSLVITVLVLVLSNAVLGQKENVLSRFEGMALLVLFAAFIYYTFRQSAVDNDVEKIEMKQMTTLKIWALIVIGLSLLVAGGRMVVTGAENIALDLGISEKIIALTIVAAGTSLPELVTSVVAASKKNSDIAIGNVIGSNIFNLLFILPVSAVIHPVSYATTFNREMLLLIGGTIIVILYMFAGKRYKVDRWEGALLLGVFLAYTIFLIQQEL